MVQNTLKQKARSFAQKHDLPYLTALKAVDEPLHGLRDLIYRLQRESDTFQSHFRLIGDHGRFSAAYPTPDEAEYTLFGEEEGSRRYHRELIQSRGLSQLSMDDFFILLGRRTELLIQSGAADIWQYRELQRAGVLEGAPLMDPVFHHYSTRISDTHGVMIHRGAELGIFGVNIAPQSQITERYHLIPVTVDQLEALRAGERLSYPVELPLNHPPTAEARELRWKDSYVAAYVYMDEQNSENRGIRVLLKSPVADLDAELRSRGIDPSRLQKDEGFSLGVELDHRLCRDMLIMSSGDRSRWIATPTLLVLG